MYVFIDCYESHLVRWRKTIMLYICTCYIHVHVRLYVLKLYTKIDSHSVFNSPKNYGFVCDGLSEDL